MVRDYWQLTEQSKGQTEAREVLLPGRMSSGLEPGMQPGHLEPPLVNAALSPYMHISQLVRLLPSIHGMPTMTVVAT